MTARDPLLIYSLGPSAPARRCSLLPILPTVTRTVTLYAKPEPDPDAKARWGPAERWRSGVRRRPALASPRFRPRSEVTAGPPVAASAHAAHGARRRR